MARTSFLITGNANAGAAVVQDDKILERILCKLPSVDILMSRRTSRCFDELFKGSMPMIDKLLMMSKPSGTNELIETIRDQSRAGKAHLVCEGKRWKVDSWRYEDGKQILELRPINENAAACGSVVGPAWVIDTMTIAKGLRVDVMVRLTGEVLEPKHFDRDDEVSLTRTMKMANLTLWDYVEESVLSESSLDDDEKLEYACVRSTEHWSIPPR